MSDSSNSLPPAALDQESVKQKYREERDKRLRPDGNGQYLRLTDQLSHYLDDPYTPVTEREPKTDHVTFAFIGGGFGGLVTGARLVEAGIKDVRIIDKAGDFGGTWYWNRYPGAQCDTASFVYLPLLEETGHMPSEKYTHAPEILEHSQRIGKHYGLYENALFHTEVKELAWDDEAGHARTDFLVARVWCVATGITSGRYIDPLLFPEATFSSPKTAQTKHCGLHDLWEWAFHWAAINKVLFWYR